MSEDKDELIAKGHGTRHYSCGHESRCRCRHNGLHVEVDGPCPDCRQNETGPGRLAGKDLNQAELLNYFLTGKLPEDNSLQERILANTSTQKKTYQEWVKQKDNTI